MKRTRIATLAAIAALLLIAAIPASAQTRPVWAKAADIERGQAGSIRGTIQELDTAHSSFRLAADGETTDIRINGITDAVSTQFSGFGAAGEVLRGTNGYAQLRTGDRVEIRGTGLPDAAMNVTQVLLLGRPVSQAAVPAVTTAMRPGTVEGVILQINANDGRIVIEAPNRQTTTVLAKITTPVYWQGDIYRITNLEVGDRIRVEVESTTDAGVRAKAIDVTESVRAATSTTPAAGRTPTRTVGSVVGRVSRIDTRLMTFRISRPGETELVVDAANAVDEYNRAFRLNEMRNGDIVQISGVYESNGALRANTIRYTSEDELGREPQDTNVVDRGNPPDRDEASVENGPYEAVLVYGVVTETLGTANVLRVRDTNGGEDIDVLTLDDFVVRQKSGGYITADQLKIGDRVAIQAFRNEDGEYIAQTIRLR